MKILFACVLLMLLSATVSPVSPGERYKNFKNQHIVETMNDSDCDLLISSRKIYDNGKCKDSNTFIVSDEQSVKAICEGAGRLIRKDQTSSDAKFNIGECTLKEGAKKPDCKYTYRHVPYVRILVSCEEGFPVHYYGTYRPK